jgi:putative hydrolase of the HAD superfamily
MVIRAVLFDVGGPIDTEELSEPLKDECIRDAAREPGIAVDDERYAAANRFAIESFAQDAYLAIAWHLCDGDEGLLERAYGRFRELQAERIGGRDVFTLRPGIRPLLEGLREQGLLLGLAANQPTRVIESLERRGIASLFGHTRVSGHHGYLKPDPRLFLRACAELGVDPDECIMVGDRVDNDIIPARRLGMLTVLFRTGRHAEQRPRGPDEMPDIEVSTVNELLDAIAVLRSSG